jgi:hypothetical protein
MVDAMGRFGVGASPGGAIGSCVAVGACAMHPPAASPQTSAARQIRDIRTALIEHPSARIWCTQRGGRAQ